VKILGIQPTSFVDDYSEALIRIDTEDGKPLELRLSIEVLQDIVFRLGQALNFARQEALAKGTNLPISYSKVVDAKVQGLGRGVVGLGLATDDGLIQYFAVPTKLSAYLRPYMEKGEEISRVKAGSEQH
jgi:hypothetical protein